MKLVFKSTGQEPTIGQALTDFRGEQATLKSIEKPRHGGSTGRVYVQPFESDWTQGYYPSVFGLEWIEREDQA